MTMENEAFEDESHKKMILFQLAMFIFAWGVYLTMIILDTALILHDSCHYLGVRTMVSNGATALCKDGSGNPVLRQVIPSNKLRLV